MNGVARSAERRPFPAESFSPRKKELKPGPFYLALALFVITGCKTAPLPEPLGERVARATLERAQKAYDEGDYAKAISALKGGGWPVFESVDSATRLEAMKLEAFSYCLTNQVTECRAQFSRILDAFPGFDLSVAEGKHPTWGPAFQTAKRLSR